MTTGNFWYDLLIVVVGAVSTYVTGWLQRHLIPPTKAAKLADEKAANTTPTEAK